MPCHHMKSIALLALLALLMPPHADGEVKADGEIKTVTFPAREAKFVRFVIQASDPSQPCLDELEVFGPDAARNLALAKGGAKATASSCLPGHAIHQIAHLNDGLYGNNHSWIAATRGEEWAQIELPAAAPVARVVFSRDREGAFKDRTPVSYEIRLSLDGLKWQSVAKVAGQPKVNGLAPYVPPARLPEPVTYDGLVRYAFLCERTTWQRMDAKDHLSPLHSTQPYWSQLARLKPTERVLFQMDEMIERLAAKGVDVTVERQSLAALHQRSEDDSRYLDARLAKRQLMLRDPDLAPLQKILFVKRHPYLSTHNYSDVLDSQFKPGGGVYLLEIPRPGGRLSPSQAKLVTLFDGSKGIARDPIADFAADKVYFAFRPDQAQSGEQEPYWHLLVMNAAGSNLCQLTDGPFHDYYPCPLPDGGLAFISTRCKERFLCWRPQAFVLFRREANGDIKPLSFANLSEWTPAVMRDGRILWTRSEYLDKGANFSHTLWAARPDGTFPELVYGNNTINCYINGREVPGTREILCTIFSHGGDHNGPLGLIDLARAKSPFDPEAMINITPDTVPRYDMNWPRNECWRDPVPVTREYFLASHAPADRFGIFLADRYGNRELLYLDPEIGSMSPSVFRPEPKPPLITSPTPLTADPQLGHFVIADVYQGLGPAVPPGKVKFIRVCQEVRADLEQLASGEFRRDHNNYLDFYATPVHKVSGPNGWTSYVAKASLGLAPVEADGSASFEAPTGKVLYFEALDENLNELQRMRSVVQLQPGEERGCVGCHEHRRSAPPARPTLASRRAPSKLALPPWGAVPYSYERVVQPVWDARCVQCHDVGHKRGINLTATLDAEKVPASYRTLIQGGWVHYADMNYGVRPSKAEPMSIGTLQSKLFKVLETGHHGVKLTRDEMHAVKCWIDLNCPLWPDYTWRMQRPAAAQVSLAK